MRLAKDWENGKHATNIVHLLSDDSDFGLITKYRTTSPYILGSIYFHQNFIDGAEWKYSTINITQVYFCCPVGPCKKLFSKKLQENQRVVILDPRNND